MKLFFYILSSFTFLLYGSASFAQVKCGADEVRAKLIAADPAYKRSLDEMDQGIREYINSHPVTTTSFTAGTAATLYYIPCVVHVIHDGGAIGSAFNPTDAQILGAIDYINKVYDGTWVDGQGGILGAGDIQVKFVLAVKTPNNVATTGIERLSGAAVPNYLANGVNVNLATGAPELSVKNLSRWDPNRYYNIWVVNKIDGCTGTFCGCACDAGFIAGYAYFPPALGNAAATNLDGTIMLASQFISGQKTLPHELGHALNLYHPFEGNTSPGPNTCPPNTSPTTQGDKCSDTDPITNPQLAPNTPFACRTGQINPCITLPTLFSDNTEKNFMNYTNCYQLFTNNQKARMQASVAGTQRMSLATSWANGQGAYPGPFVVPPPPAVTPSTLTPPLGGDVGGILRVKLNGQVIYSLNATTEGMYQNNSNKWYDALQINAGSIPTMEVEVLNNTNRIQLGVWIDYNNNGIFETVPTVSSKQDEQIFFNTDYGTNTGATTTIIRFPFTVPTVWAGANNFVRMRIIQDLSTIYPGVADISPSSASFSYGQAEDYPIFLTGGTVPVKLISFTGTQSPVATDLRWSTAQELNSESFDIERSVNSASFATIGNVKTTGAATGASYTFRDGDVSVPGDYLYRLKAKDLDASFAYSNILKFSVKEAKKMIVVGNPFTYFIKVILPYNNGKAEFRLTDAAGRLVYSNTAMLTGSPTVSLKLDNSNTLSHGVYILEAIVNGERYTQKLYKK